MHSDTRAMIRDAAGTAAVGGPLMRAHLSLSRSMWRIGPAWSVLAGAVASGWVSADGNETLRLVAAVALGDLAWGNLRGVVPQHSIDPGQGAHVPAPLPYARVNTPLSRWLYNLSSGTGTSAAGALQTVVVSLALTAGLSLLLGPIALALSAGALSLTALAWALRVNRRAVPSFIPALLDVALPWSLGASVAGLWASVPRDWVGPGTLLAAFTILSWGIHVKALGGAARSAGIWLGQGAVLVSLIIMRQAWAGAIVTALLAAPSWWLLRDDAKGESRAPAWWWAAMAVAAVAVAQAA